MEYKMRITQRIVTLLITGALCFSVTSATADTYRWKDKDGKTHYGAAVPAEYAEQPYDVLNNQGIVIEHVEDTSIPIELLAEQETQSRKPLISDEERLRQSDRLLVVQYRSEEDITEALELQLAQLGYDTRLITQSYDSANTAIRDQIAQAADQQRANLPVAEEQQKGIDSLYARRMRDENKLESLARREQTIRDRFQAYIDRYRFLTEKNQGGDETKDQDNDQSADPG
jgi:hypothetical protein